MKGRSIPDAFAAGYNSFMGIFPESNLANNQAFKDRARGFLDSASSSAGNASIALANLAQAANDKAANWPQFLGELQKISASNEGILRNSERSVKANDEQTMKLALAIAQAINRSIATIAEDYAQNNLRI